MRKILLGIGALMCGLLLASCGTSDADAIAQQGNDLMACLKAKPDYIASSQTTFQTNQDYKNNCTSDDLAKYRTYFQCSLDACKAAATSVDWALATQKCAPPTGLSAKCQSVTAAK